MDKKELKEYVQLVAIIIVTCGVGLHLNSLIRPSSSKQNLDTSRDSATVEKIDTVAPVLRDSIAARKVFEKTR